VRGTQQLLPLITDTDGYRIPLIRFRKMCAGLSQDEILSYVPARRYLREVIAYSPAFDTYRDRFGTFAALSILQELEAKSGNGFYINKKHAGGVPVLRTYLIRNFT